MLGINLNTVTSYILPTVTCVSYKPSDMTNNTVKVGKSLVRVIVSVSELIVI